MLERAELRIPRRLYQSINTLVSPKKKAAQGQAADLLSQLIYAKADDQIAVVSLYNQLSSYGILGFRVAASDEEQFGLPPDVVVAGRTVISVDASAVADTCFVRYQQIVEEDEPVDGEVELPDGFCERCDWTVPGAVTCIDIDDIGERSCPTSVHALSTIHETDQGSVYGFADQCYTVQLPDGQIAHFCPTTVGMRHPDGTWQTIQSNEVGLIVEGVYFWEADNYERNLPPAPATIADVLVGTMIANFKKERGDLLVVLEDIANTSYAKRVINGKFNDKTGHCKPGPDPFDPSDFKQVIKIKLLPEGGVKRTPGTSTPGAASKRQKPTADEEPIVDAENVFRQLSALSALYTNKDILTTGQIAELQRIAAAILSVVALGVSTNMFEAVEENSRKRLEAARKQVQMINQHLAGGMVMPPVETSATMDAVQAAIDRFATALSKSGFPTVGGVEQLAQELSKLEGLGIDSVARQAAAKVLEQLTETAKQCSLEIGVVETAFTKCAAAGITIEKPDMAPKMAVEAALTSLEALVNAPDSDVAELVHSVELTEMRVKQLLQLKDALIAKKKDACSRLEKVLKDLLV